MTSGTDSFAVLGPRGVSPAERDRRQRQEAEAAQEAQVQQGKLDHALAVQNVIRALRDEQGGVSGGGLRTVTAPAARRTYTLLLTDRDELVAVVGPDYRCRVTPRPPQTAPIKWLPFGGERTVGEMAKVGPLREALCAAGLFEHDDLLRQLRTSLYPETVELLGRIAKQRHPRSLRAYGGDWRPLIRELEDAGLIELIKPRWISGLHRSGPRCRVQISEDGRALLALDD